MMVFEQGDRVNFVDVRNCQVEFEIDQHGNELAGYFFARDRERFREQGDKRWRPEGLDYMVFDHIGLERVADDPAHEEEGGFVLFRLVDPEREQREAWLVLFDHHSGEYGHWVQVKQGNRVIQQELV